MWERLCAAHVGCAARLRILTVRRAWAAKPKLQLLNHALDFQRVLQPANGVVQLGGLGPRPLQIAQPQFDAAMLVLGRDARMELFK